MADYGDDAQAIETKLREANIVNATRPLACEGTEDCTSCGDEIDLGRKNAMPSSRLCIECQQKLENQNRLRNA